MWIDLERDVWRLVHGRMVERRRLSKCAANRRYKSRNRDRIRNQERERHLTKTFGITSRQYEVMSAAQGGVCEICKRPTQDGKPLGIDHCHVTQTVRGLLCRPCNNALGLYQDNPALLRAAASYLERSRA